MEEVCRPRHPESGKLLQNVRQRARTSGRRLVGAEDSLDSKEFLLRDDENDNHD